MFDKCHTWSGRAWLLSLLLGAFTSGCLEASPVVEPGDTPSDTPPADTSPDVAPDTSSDDTDPADTRLDDTRPDGGPTDTGPADTRPDGGPTDTADAVDSTDTTDAGHDTDTITPADPRQAMRLHVLDVGQGESIIVEFPCGAMLVDTGGEVTPASAASPGFDSVTAFEDQVRAFFASRPDLQDTFDLVVLSHPHLDHTRGVTRLLELEAGGALTIRNVVTNGAEGSGSGIREQRALHDFADQHPDVARWYVLERKTLDGFTNAVIDPFGPCTVGDGPAIDPTITALWGRIDNDSPLSSRWTPNDLDNGNNHSVVLRVDFGEASVLLPGDLEETGLAELIARHGASGRLDVDVYKVSHHGSHNGTTAALVNAMSPDLALISAGPSTRQGDYTAWAFGHPRWRAVSDLLGDLDSAGVLADRALAITAPVAVDYAQGHGVFADKVIAPAVYCTGWEGLLTVTLWPDGAIALPARR